MKECLFIWVPKAAGTSIFESLYRNYGCMKRKDISSAKKFKNQGSISFGHISVAHLLKNEFVSKDYFQRAYKFCFVRNPWDRAVSLHRYFHDRVSGYSFTFPAFLERLKEGITPVGLYNNSGMSMCNPQTSWVLDADGNPLADFVGRFEQLERDWGKVCAQLGKELPLGHANRGKHDHYKTYYKDRAMRKLVREIYISDVETFGYRYQD